MHHRRFQSDRSKQQPEDVAKPAGKQKGPAQKAKREADTSTPSLFQQAMWAARELWMGPLDGQLGKIGELENETLDCEDSTREAIRAAEPTKKLSALRHGIDELQNKLCASATRYYNKCFELALKNRAELDATHSVVAAELGRTSHVSNPAEFARLWTTGDLSTFLRVTAFDEKEKAQEIGSDGRVREFIRHACGDYSDVLGEQNVVFLLPRWPTGPGIGARMVQRFMETEGRSPKEETEDFILGTEEILIKHLRRAIAHAHRLALVDQANVVITTSSSPDTDIIAGNVPQKARTRLIAPRRSDDRSFRMSVIFKAIESGKKGLEYCSFLRDHELLTPKDWQLDGCDANYVLAYQDTRQRRRKFRKLINKEKTRHSRLLSNLMLNDRAELDRIKKVVDKNLSLRSL